jgi:hypothetical protein
VQRRKRPKKTGRPLSVRGVRLAPKEHFRRTVKAGNDFRVRSRYEKKCVAYFEEHNITYRYEPLLLLGGRQYRPDFFLPEYNLFVEICGFGHMPFYNDRIKFKKDLYKKHNVRALFIRFNGRGSLDKLLGRELKTAGVRI